MVANRTARGESFSKNFQFPALFSLLNFPAKKERREKRAILSFGGKIGREKTSENSFILSFSSVSSFIKIPINIKLYYWEEAS
jgi:hypothetical protein